MLPAETHPEEYEPDEKGLWLNIPHVGLELSIFICNEHVSPCVD